MKNDEKNLRDLCELCVKTILFLPADQPATKTPAGHP